MDGSQQDEYLAPDQRQTPTGHSGHHKGALGAGGGPGAAHGHIARDKPCRWGLQSPPPRRPPTPMYERVQSGGRKTGGQRGEEKNQPRSASRAEIGVRQRDAAAELARNSIISATRNEKRN